MDGVCTIPLPTLKTVPVKALILAVRKLLSVD